MKAWEKGVIVGLLFLVLVSGCVKEPPQTKITREQAIAIATGTKEVQEYLKVFPNPNITADIDTKLCLANNVSLEDCIWIVVYYDTYCCSTQDIAHESWRNTALVRISPEGEVLQSDWYGDWGAGDTAEKVVPLRVEEAYSKLGECDNMSDYVIEVVDSYVIIKDHCVIDFSADFVSANYTGPNEITIVENHGKQAMTSSYVHENTTVAVIREIIGPLPDGEYNIKVIVSTYTGKVVLPREPYWRNITKLNTTVAIGRIEEIGDCNSYEMPMTREIIDNCTCPEGYDKFNRFMGAICFEHHEDSMEPCDEATDCTDPERCISWSEKGPFKCMRQIFGCYSFYNDKNEVESWCVD
jgi:hypothetical protein